MCTARCSNTSIGSAGILVITVYTGVGASCRNITSISGTSILVIAVNRSENAWTVYACICSTETVIVANNIGKYTLSIHAIICGARIAVITSSNVHRCGRG